LAERFAASIGKEVKFSQMPFGALIAANATGKVDMIAASIFVMVLVLNNLGQELTLVLFF